MALLSFPKKRNAMEEPSAHGLGDILQGCSIEVMPRTAAKVEDFKGLLPKGTRVYIAHIEGTPIEEMVATAKRLTDDGLTVMPHFPARIIKDGAMLENWIKMYQSEAGVTQALLLAGGVDEPHGDFHSSMQLLDTGLFDKHGFKRLHVAGHPEGNKDIDVAGSTKIVDEAMMWKQGFSEQTDAKMAIATQFAFDAKPIIAWAEGLREMGVTMPVHLGIAGPAKLQTLIKFAFACGVGPSVKVLQKRAADVTKLLLPYEPTEILSDMASYCAENADHNFEQIHFFPLGGIKKNAEWIKEYGANEDVANPA